MAQYFRQNALNSHSITHIDWTLK